MTFTLPPHSKSLAARGARNVGRLIRSKPPLFDRFSGCEGQISAAIPARHYELAVIEHFWCASYASLLRPLCDRLMLDMHNIESELARTHAMAAGGLAGWLSARFAGMYRRLEREWLPVFDTVLVTSADDRTRLRHPDLRVFPNAIPDVPRLAVREENVIAFSGNLEYHPNTEAVRWFAREVWPLIHVRLPEAEWRLIGRNPEAIREFIEHSPATNVAGPVEDAIAALAEARVCVVPLLSGSGTRFKILEAWAAERAVVSTTIVRRGSVRGTDNIC
ncbi:MAG: glycosyltransferase family 4 protein [Acidobacteriota bacterium]